MKITIFNWRDWTNPEGGGAEENIHEIGSRLVNKGHEVTLYCGRYKGSAKTEIIDGIKIIRVGGKFTVYILAPLAYLFKRGRGSDIVIDDVNGIPFFTPVFVRGPLIALFHHRVGSIFFTELPWPISNAGLFIEDKLFPFLYSEKRIVTVSESSKNELIDLGFKKNRIDIVYNGVDNDYYKPINDGGADQSSILFMGRLKRYKRVDILIKVASELLRDFPDLKVNIVGNGDDRERLERIVQDQGLEGIVIFHGFVPEKTKLMFLQTCRIFAIPSEKEGWGITALEASACGAPVVAFNVPGLRDSVKHGYSGFLVKDEKEFKDRLHYLLLDEDARNKIHKSSRIWSLSFNWEKSTDDLEHILFEEYQNWKRRGQ